MHHPTPPEANPRNNGGIDSELHSDARIARLLNEDSTAMIDEVVGLFVEADRVHPESDVLIPEIHMVQADDVRTYGRFSRDTHIDHKNAIIALHRARNLNREPHERILSSVFDTVPNYIPSSPVEAAYMRIRTDVQSGLGHAIRLWNKDIAHGYNSDLPIEERHQRSAARYGVDVQCIDLRGLADENRMPLGGDLSLIMIPQFQQRAQGEALAIGAAAASLHIVDLSYDDAVTAGLRQIDYSASHVARTLDARAGNVPAALEHTGTRMLVESVYTAAQATALLLGGVKQEFSLREAIESLDKNGAYKLLSILPSGVIGPMAISGTQWNPDFVLNQEKLAVNEFALSKEFQENIVKTHAKNRQLALASVSMSGLGVTVREAVKRGDEKTIAIEKRRIMPSGIKSRLPGLGCPASVNQMRFGIDAITRSLPEQ